MTTALALRRCGCGVPLPNPFDVRCGECARHGFGCVICGRPALGQSLCGHESCREKAWELAGEYDLDDESEAEHFRLLDIEADMKDDDRWLDRDRAF